MYAPIVLRPHTRQLVCCLALLLGLLATLGPIQVAQAAALTVTTTADELNTDGDCSLREAVRAANLDTAVDACVAGSGADTITLPAGTYLLTLYSTGNDNAALEDDLDLAGTVTIAGADARTTVIDTSTSYRLFHILSGAQATISGVTIRGGVAYEGGGILNSGTLTITNSSISGNEASYAGGGIYNTGTLTLNSSLVSRNTADDSGSTGGGIYNSGTLTLNNTTVSGNLADSDELEDAYAGGIYNSGTLTLANSTVTNNIASNMWRGGGYGGIGGGILGSFTARNSIIAGNEVGEEGEASDCQGTFIAQGVNLLGTDTGCTVSGTVLRGAPLLAPLADNGGPTLTHAPAVGSPALDAGDTAAPGSGGTACLAADQRGMTRPQDGDGDGAVRCDLGAFERRDELVVNGGFELDSNADGTPDGWSSNSRAVRSGAVVRRGSSALRHQATDNAGYTIFSDPVVPVIAGRLYIFEGWVNIPATSDAFSFELQVRWRDANSNVLSTESIKSYTAATTGWSSATAPLTAPASATQATIRQVVTSLNATVYVDDVTLRPVGDNVLSNGTFEAPANLTGWSVNSYTSASSAAAHSGTQSLRHQASDNASYTIFDESSSVQANQRYNFVSWVNIPATSDAFSFELQVRWRDSSGNAISTVPLKTYTAATSGWTSFTGLVVAPPNARYATIRQVVGSLNATIYVDDIVLAP